MVAEQRGLPTLFPSYIIVNVSLASSNPITIVKLLPLRFQLKGIYKVNNCVNACRCSGEPVGVGPFQLETWR